MPFHVSPSIMGLCFLAEFTSDDSLLRLVELFVSKSNTSTDLIFVDFVAWDPACS